MAESAWLDGNAYPFRSRLLDLPCGKMHYVDEGHGDPVVMIHGNPTWSFFYRHLIRRLSEVRRCVAMDHIGFGLSDRPRDWSHLPEDHALNVERLIEHLGLDGITMIVHDWGGPIGLAYAVKRPGRIRRLVISNTWLWPDCGWRPRLFGALVGGAAGRRFLSAESAVPGRLLGWAAARERSARRHYAGPLIRAADRRGASILPGRIVGSAPWLEGLWAGRHRLGDKEVLFAWGMRDPVFTGAVLRRWQEAFPHAVTAPFPKAGHFLYESEGRAVVERVARFVGAH